jgi:adenylylsulfate kinase-like enzyme
VDTPFEECARRDVKGLYAKALRGELKNFTGLDSPYQAPTNPEVHLLAGQKSLKMCLDDLLNALGI